MKIDEVCLRFGEVEPCPARQYSHRLWRDPDTWMAEGEGVEPPIPCGIPVFKTGAFNHSATPPA